MEGGREGGRERGREGGREGGNEINPLMATVAKTDKSIVGKIFVGEMLIRTLKAATLFQYFVKRFSIFKMIAKIIKIIDNNFKCNF